MKKFKIKRVVSFLLTCMLLCSLISTNFVFASALDSEAATSGYEEESSEDISVDVVSSEDTLGDGSQVDTESNESEDSSAESTESVEEVDVTDSQVYQGVETGEFYIKDSLTDKIAKDTGIMPFAVDNGEILVINAAGVIYDFAAGRPIDLGMGIKYVTNDANNPDNMGKLRYVYCLEYQKQFPAGETSSYSGWSNEKVSFAIFHGATYLGETCRNYVYSTGNWMYDYFVTQIAVHILNNEFTLSQAVASINSAVGVNGNVASSSDKALVIDRITKLVNAANNSSSAEYSKFNSDGWIDYTLEGNQPKFDVTGYSDTWGLDGGYYRSGGTFSIKFTTYHGSDLRNQLTSVDISVTDGVEVRKSGNSSFSDFALYIPEDKYNEWKVSGKEIVVTVKATSPSLWGTAMYAPSNSAYQTTGIISPYEFGEDMEFSKEITLHINAESGKLQLVKASSQPEVTDGNDCYSLEGAEYTVYSDKDCKTSVGVLTTDVNGKSGVMVLPFGDYYVKETKAPKGYVLDTTVNKVSITDEYVSEVYILDVKDEPSTDPVGILLKKVDADTGLGEAQNAGTLAGAEFEIKYYDVESSEDPALSGSEAVRTWVVKTDEDGFAMLSSDYKVSGDDFYLDSFGYTTLPMGTLTIQEKTAPEGYLLNDTVYVVPITSDGSTGSVNAYVAPEVSEKALKFNLTKIQSGTDKVIEGAEFEHIRPNGEKETLTTDKNGELSFVGLEYGDHVVREVSAPEGYSVNTNEIKFTVGEDNSITVNSKAIVTDTNGNITVSVNDDGCIDAVVEDKPLPYTLKVIKQDGKGTVLAGAEFTLYSDKDCTKDIETKVSDSRGVLELKNLVIGETYYLKETKAPDGYVQPSDSVVYEISANSVPVDGKFDFYINGTKYTVEDVNTNDDVYLSGKVSDRVVNLKVVNNKEGAILPETGSVMTMVFIGVGILLVVCSLLVLFTNRSKNKTKNN